VVEELLLELLAEPPLLLALLLLAVLPEVAGRTISFWPAWIVVEVSLFQALS
jgi:hypothetical protein